MSVKEIDQLLEQWEMNVRDLHRRVILAPTPRERETLARRLAAGPRLDGIVHGGGTGTGSPHHRPVVRCLRRRRPKGPDIRADRGFPPALGEAEQAALKEAVQELPDAAGIGMANWTLRQAQEEGGS